MKIIKKINNNVAIGLDKKNKEIVVFGKGVGFGDVPYELTDLKKVDRTYYDIDSKYYGLLNELPEAIFGISHRIIDTTENELKISLNPNLLFTLSDHLNFAIERLKSNISIVNPLSYDIQVFYPKEVNIGKQAIKMIEEEMNIILPDVESCNIAIHIVNAELGNNNLDETIENTKLLREIVDIIKRDFSIDIDENSYNYSRFIMHLRYLLKRNKDDKQINSDNVEMFDTMVVKYPKTYKCIGHIDRYLETNVHRKCTEEELLYLMIHINRLCA